MLFNSAPYLIFLPVVCCVYFLLPLNTRRPFLLLASYVFYWFFSVPLSLLLAASTVLDYTAARVIAASGRPAVRRAALWASIAGNLSILGFFKYFNFFRGSLAALLGGPVPPVLEIVLPMGISFYTFQTMSYTIDAYRGRLRPARSFVDVALFVAFFPQLVAGPIMRGADLLHQFRENHQPNAERILSGTLLCIWGLFKKILIADPMGRIVESAYGTAAQPSDPHLISGLGLLLGTYAFAVQIYCDFSAYTDICRGSGRILGFRIMENFRAPYLAASISEFWRRWHISLSTWLRDYLYIPLGGNRLGRWRTGVNLLVTMLLGGLWHGANWTFVVWGGLHGLFLLAERGLGIHRLEPSVLSWKERWVRRIVTFHLVCLAWVFFRAPNVPWAAQAIARILTLADGRSLSFIPTLLLLIGMAGQAGRWRPQVHRLLLRYPAASRWAVYGSLALLAMMLGSAQMPEFIYFQF